MKYKHTPSPWFVRFSLVHFSFVRSSKRHPKYLLRAHSFIGAGNNESNEHQSKHFHENDGGRAKNGTQCKQCGKECKDIIWL